MDSAISIQSARLYTALHPLFSKSDLGSRGMLDVPASRLFHIVAHSASTLIDHFARLNEDDKIISLWMTAEPIFEAGLLWASYLVNQRYSALPESRPFHTMGTKIAMSSVMKVSTLLASFAARWKSGRVYADAWETLTELLWSMV